jgi:hypothetical protein
LRASHGVGTGPWLLGGAARCEVQSANGVELVRPSASFGPAWIALRYDALRLAFRAEPFVELVDATGTDSGTGRSGHALGWAFGVSGAADVSWMWSGNMGIVLGIDANERTRPTEVDAHGAPRALLSAFDFGVNLGVRVAAP